MMATLSESIDSLKNDHLVHIYLRVQGKKVERKMDPIFELLFLIQPEKKVKLVIRQLENSPEILEN